jgi:outer membrane protein TolC
MPIFTGFRRGADVTLAKLALEQEQLRLAQLHEQVQLQYQQAIGQRDRAAASITARQRTVDQAQRVYDLTLLRHDQGLASQLEVADARLALLQARANRAQAIADYHVSDALVRRALGASSAALSLSR